jgi:hypothetical protein
MPQPINPKASSLMNQLMAWRSVFRFSRQSVISTQPRDCATYWPCLLWITKWHLLAMVAVQDIGRY